ncbi:twin-arginine translocase subunit TatC [Thorsellia anophelis]|uniref:Sec-independent protein translocase protein TatC n=1 Tax=Thorsellia anophelis DSM 18579 TaxID=1123402 RepID=A0A1I0AQ77_9GAMM|nr:twin-arginine translocase subunit TatC [Thorsellia anophelis]SES96479.1 sec-independent protein translocase protein TatC [Thorsellia anophelis DSM 18579]
MSVNDTKNNESHDQAESGFLSHLVALRACLVRSFCAIMVVFLVLIYFSNNIYHIVASPLIEKLPEGTSFQAISIASPWLAPIKLTFMVSLFIAMPYVLYQIWSFVAPALYRHERKRVLPLLISSVGLFYLGVMFAYFVLFPLIFSFFTQTAPQDVLVAPDINQYLSFVLTLFFSFGLAFQIPIATLLLCLTGIVTIESLKSKRPYIFVGAFVIGMFLTPPDIFSQTLLAIPMYLLFEISLLFARFYIKEKPEVDEIG